MHRFPICTFHLNIDVGLMAFQTERNWMRARRTKSLGNAQRQSLVLIVENDHELLKEVVTEDAVQTMPQEWGEAGEIECRERVVREGNPPDPSVNATDACGLDLSARCGFAV